MSKLRKSARGRTCEIRIPGVCQGGTETTVLAHLNGGGMGGKRIDLHAAFACSSCHQWVDSHYDQQSLLYFYEAIIRTQEIWVREKIIKLP